ncbi:MAG: hypothetical protein AVDCRST_MAG54-2474, partial [uncultured Actinomycetospora sp.]
MTAEPRPHDHDLSDAFGRPAAASLRGLLPPRPRRGGEPAGEPAGEPVETDGTAPVDEAEMADEVTDAPAPTPAPRTPRG